MKLRTVAMIGCSGLAMIGTAGSTLAVTPSKPAIAKATERMLALALKKFKSNCHRYPTTEEGINALSVSPAGMESLWKGPYIQGDAVPLDPWGNPFVYFADQRHFKITSLGKDGMKGGRGEAADIVNKG